MLTPFHFEADPDPAFHFEDPDPALSPLMWTRTRIQLPKIMRIHADPEHCL
jgi:hypothetical protein